MADNAYRKLTQSSNDNFRWRLFEKTSCLIPPDGSEDNKINSEGLPDYKVPSPIPLDPSTAPADPSSVPEHDSEVEEDVFDDFEGEDKIGDTEIVEGDELVQMAGSSIFSICNFHFNIMYIVLYFIRSFCFEFLRLSPRKETNFSSHLEAAIQSCSVKKVFLKIHRKPPLPESLFNKVAGSKACNFNKKETGRLAELFSCESLRNF